MLDWLFGKKKEEPKKPKKNEKEDNKWKYDLLVQFLCSPQWRVTVLNFVDQNCIVFDNEEQNKFQYTNIHKKFKKLVAGLFDSVMEEIGLGEEELLELIAQGLESKNKRLFQQLLICDDFLKFKEVMVKRNRALEQEAANELLKHGTKSTLVEGRPPQSQGLQKPPSLKGQKTAEEMEEEMLRKAMEESALEQEARKSKVRDLELQEARRFEHQSMLLQNQRKENDRQLQIQRAKQESDRRQREWAQEQERRRQEQERKKVELQRHQQDLNRLKQKEQEKEIEKEKVKAKQLPPVRRVEKQSKPEPPVEILAEATVVQFDQEPEQPKVVEEKKAVTEEKKTQTIQDRKRRLLEQRELLKKKKMEERQKELETNQPAKNVQNIVLDDQGFHENKKEEQPEPEEKISTDEIERRRNLMKRIKNKIIDDM